LALGLTIPVFTGLSIFALVPTLATVFRAGLEIVTFVTTDCLVLGWADCLFHSNSVCLCFSRNGFGILRDPSTGTSTLVCRDIVAVGCIGRNNAWGHGDTFLVIITAFKIFLALVVCWESVCDSCGTCDSSIRTLNLDLLNAAAVGETSGKWFFDVFACSSDTASAVVCFALVSVGTQYASGRGQDEEKNECLHGEWGP